MKKLFTTIVALGLVAGAAFAQRTVDIASTVSAPTAGSTIQSGVAFDLDFEVTNNGPDAVKAGDSVIVFLVLNNQIQNLTRTYTNLDIASGASATVTLPGVNLSGGQSGTVNVCGLVILIQRSGMDTVRDNTVTGNNIACQSLNYQNTASIGGELTLNEFSSTVFPNPATTEATISVQGTFTETATVNVYDLNGKLVFTQAQNGAATNEFNVPTSDLKNGVYVYTVTAGDKTTRGKFVVNK